MTRLNARDTLRFSSLGRGKFARLGNLENWQ